MSTQMPFGTRQHIGYVPAPLSGLDHYITRAVSSKARTDGPPSITVGVQPYQSYDFSWKAPRDQVQPVLDAFSFNDGPPYYFLNPGALMKAGTFNALPPHWAAPGLFARGHGIDALSGTYSLISADAGVLDREPVVRGSVSTYGVPPVGVHFTLGKGGVSPLAAGEFDGGARPYARVPVASPEFINVARYNPSATLLIPPGWRVHLLVAADCTEAGISVATALSDDGYFDDVVRAGTLTVPATIDSTLLLGNGAQWAMVDIGFDAAPGAVAPAVTLYGMAALYVPEDVAGYSIPDPLLWSPGRGQMPLWPKRTDVNVTSYQAFDKQLTGVSMNLTEGYIPW